jgi:hypothetical protein
MSVAGALEALQPIFDLIGMVLGPIFEAIGYVLRFVGETILGTMNVLLGIWIGILSIIQNIMRSFGANTTEIDKALGDANKNQQKVQQQMKDLWENGGANVANEAANTAEKLGKLGDTADNVSRQLTNIPSGFNTALREWQASFATSSTGGSAGATGRARAR